MGYLYTDTKPAMISNHDEFPDLEKLITEAPDASGPPAPPAPPTTVSPDSPMGGPVMSSLQIAEITGKEHAHVMRDIRAILEEAGIGLSKFGSSYLNSQNKAQPCYLLPRRECDLVVSGYSVKYRLAIIDRWQELEGKQSFQVPQTMGEALRLAADLTDQLLVLAPKAEALDRIAESDGQMNITTAAKTLQIRPRVLFGWLDTHGWTYRRPGSSERLPYQPKISQGLMTMKAFRFTDKETGESRVVERSLITAKGLAKLAEAFGKAGVL